MPRAELIRKFCVAVLFSGAVMAEAQDSDGFWSAGKGGSWATAGNWEGGTIADGTNNTASFGAGIEPPMPSIATFTLDGTRAIGNVIFYPTNTTINWTLSAGSGGPLTLASDLDIPTINVNLANQKVTINVVLAGSDGMEKLGDGTLILAATNTYTGGTLLGPGEPSTTLLVNGAITDPDGVTNEIGILGGTGWIAGPVLIETGCVLSPGSNGIGTLAISNTLTLQGAGVVLVEVNAATLEHDLVTGLSNVNYGGGVLVVSNLAGTPALGQSYQLFNAAASSGNFRSITPQLTNGLRWRFDPASGVLSAVSTASQPDFADVGLSGANVVLQVENGAPGVTNYLLGSTNPALPLVNWTRLGTNVFDVSGNATFTNAPSAGWMQQFYLISVPPTL